MRTRLAALFIAFSMVLPLARAEDVTRIWTDTQGRKVEATFAGLDGDTVLLLTRDGRMNRVPLANLSEADQEATRTLKPVGVTVPTNIPAAQAAAKLDEIILRALEKKKVQPNPPASDEQFLRRAYLNIAGRIPTRDEAIAFLHDTSPTRRARLIDALLDSEGYESHLYNYFADMFRVRDEPDQPLMKALPYEEWLKKQIHSNRPYDQMVFDMLTATGKVWDNGACGYLLRDSGMLLDSTANTFSIFLGADIACAQCHDHPFAHWTQLQFYQLASFFGATVTQLGPEQFKGVDPNTRIMSELREYVLNQSGKDVSQYQGVVGQIVAANRYEVRDVKQNRVRLPGNYRYKNAKPNDPVIPQFIAWSKEDKLGDAYTANKVDKKKHQERLRHTFASWLTHRDNPRFSMTIANRMWKRAFGLGAAEPVRNIDDPKSCANPELLAQLSQDMKRLKFDLKEFMRVVYNTQAWQRRATTETIAMGEPYYFQGPVLRRMSAEQCWDSFMTLVLGNPDAYKGEIQGHYARTLDVDLEKATGKTMAHKLSAWLEMEKTEKARLGGSLATVGEADMKDGVKVVEHNGMKLVRASELPQPAPAGHFLREFGQSERISTDGGSTYGSEPQVLMLMNGPTQNMLVSADSLILRTAKAQPNDKEKLDSIFLSVLNRLPTDEEREAAAKQVKAGGEGAYADVLWALLNSLEFMFVQ